MDLSTVSNMQNSKKDAGNEVLYSVNDGRSVSEIIAELEDVDRQLDNDEFDKILKNKPEGGTINKNKFSSGREINGSEDTETLGEGRTGRGNDSIWQQSNDSKAHYERLGGTKENTRIVPEGRCGLVP